MNRISWMAQFTAIAVVTALSVVSFFTAVYYLVGAVFGLDLKSPPWLWWLIGR